MFRFLALVGKLLIRLGAGVAWVYGRLWGRWPAKWFDHRFDFLRGPAYWYWQERGVLGVQVISAGANVLDLCCGDGFYDIYYFAARAGHVDALDLDSGALPRCVGGKLHFWARDVVADAFPQRFYDVVLCFSALQQMREDQLRRLLLKVRDALGPGGHFFGSVSLFASNELLCCEADVRGLLVEFFPSVEIMCSPWPNQRVECYFCCRLAPGSGAGSLLSGFAGRGVYGALETVRVGREVSRGLQGLQS